MTETSLRVGILGAAGIAKKTAIAISQAESSCCLSAVASRTLQKAEDFVEELFPDKSGQIRIFGGPSAYKDLIQSDVVDALYIPLPVAVKKEWVLQALQAGKHVVIEKPAALSATDYQEFLTTAYKHNRFVLDGTMFPHHPRTTELTTRLGNQELDLGQVRRIQCQFCFATDREWETSNIRASPQGDPHGCIGDLGWYCIRFGILVFRALYNSKPVSAQVVDFECNEGGVPMDATCCVRFSENRALWFHCSFKTAFRQSFEICGSKRFVLMDDLVLPQSHLVSYQVESSYLTQYDLLTRYDRTDVTQPQKCTQELELWKNFSRICQGMTATSATKPSSQDTSGASTTTSWTAGDDAIVAEATQWAADSMLNQSVVDALMESIIKSGTVVSL